MKVGARLALAVAGGYLLGRTKKMRLALMIAAAGATGRVGMSPRTLLQNGLKELGSSPELGKLTDVVRNELLGAAKGAAITAASSRIESLSGRLQDGPLKASPDEASDETEEPEDREEEPERPARRRAASRRTSSSDGEEPARGARATATRTPVRRRARR